MGFLIVFCSSMAGGGGVWKSVWKKKKNENVDASRVSQDAASRGCVGAW